MGGDEEPKIFIDEDWKNQVEREKVEAQTATEKVESEDDGTLPGNSEDMSLFEQLISTLAAQTMMALGVIAPEGQEKVYVDLNYSRHLIDTMMMLHEKTEGNLSKEEDTMLDEAISELQQVYVARVQQSQDSVIDPSQNPADLSPPKV